MNSFHHFFKKTVAAAALILVFVSCKEQTLSEKRIEYYEWDGNEKELVLSNEFLEFRLSPKDTSFVLTEKATGREWRSNPEGGADDALADGLTKQLLQSQFSLVYSDDAGVNVTLTSLRYSVEAGRYECTLVDGAIETRYTVGNVQRMYYIPLAVRETRFVEFLEKMEKSDRNRVEMSYRLVDINKLRANDNKEELLAAYPDLAEENLFILRDTTQEFMKAQIDELLAATGYTPEDYAEDAARYNAPAEQERPVFNITVRYELDGNSLLVSVPFDEINSRRVFPITQLNLLPFFGAGGISDEGYLFVPDGSGAVINFNNGRQGQLPYNINVYGWDAGMRRDAIIHDNTASFPVFGIQRNGGTMLCIIEEGASYASVRADVSGRNCLWNSVYGQYALFHGATMDISAKSDKAVYLYQTALPVGERIAARFTPCAESGYVGMAKEYRSFLLKRGEIPEERLENEVPVAVEIIGAVNKTQHRLGIPMDLPLRLTSYQEAEEMTRNFASFGWKNVHIKMTGWFNKSVDHSVPSNVNLISVLGSAGDFRSLVSTAKDLGFVFYGEADFFSMRDNNPFDGFSLYTDAARYVTRQRMEGYPYSFVWFGERKNWGKLSYTARPVYTRALIEGFGQKTEKFGLENIAFRTIGTKLGGDYYEKRFVSREAALAIQREALTSLKEEGKSVLVKGGNAYVLPYADFITDAALTDQAFGITDISVPFCQIVLHGVVPYAGRAINLAEDYRYNLLKAIEGGAGLYFSFMSEESAILQETKFRQFYANEYDKWVADADELYRRFSEDFAGLYNQRIEGHEIPEPGVSVTIYEDGTRVVVNTGEVGYAYIGAEGTAYVGASDYLVLRGN